MPIKTKAEIQDAVAVVLSFNDEIFIIKRQNNLKAFPGYWAFPGGKVEEIDQNGTSQFKIETPFYMAMQRELLEETGLNLDQLIRGNKVISLNKIGVATSPSFNPYRFATHFFCLTLNYKPELVFDSNEVDIGLWARPSVLLERYNRGEMLAVPPVVKIISEFEKNRGSPIDLTNRAYGEDDIPWIESLKDFRQIMPLSNTLPPATRTNSFLVGDKNSPRVLIDPSPKDQVEYKRFFNLIKDEGISKIFITHQHPDHFEYSNQLARDLNIPILISKDSYTRIEQRIPNYFKHIKVEFQKEGMILTKWLGHDVKVYEVPGHDEGQLALAPENLSWFLAGDLFQGMGSVVIGGDEGDMLKYMNTLKRVINLSPKVLYPSHGIGVGGTYVLSQILKHREEREKDILKLHKQGLTDQEILKTLYQETPEKLWRYALENIHKHLEKLKKENKIN